MEEESYAIILCARDDADAERMTRMISSLQIPRNGDRPSPAEVIKVIGERRAAACNAAMRRSRARYKVYIGPEVTQVNPKMLIFAYRVFDSYERTGMVGFFGSSLPLGGDFRKARWTYGHAVWEDGQPDTVQDVMGVPGSFAPRVQALDGAVIVTRVDVPWDEAVDDIFLATAHVCALAREGYETRVSNTSENERACITSRPSPYFWQVDDAVFERARRTFAARYADVLYPLVSIMIPAYNQPRFCREALESALAQDYPNIEILIGDDSTDDRVKKALAPILETHTDIRYQYRGGLPGEVTGANVRYLLNACRGDYVNLLFHDDLIYPTKISRMMAYFVEDQEQEIAIVTSRRDSIDEEGRPLGEINRYRWSGDRIFRGTALGREILLQQANVIGEMSTVLLKRSLLQQGEIYETGIFCGYRERSMGDTSTWLELMRAGHACVFLGERLSAFRKHAEQNGQNSDTLLLCSLDWLNFLVLAYMHGAFVTDAAMFEAGCRRWRTQIMESLPVYRAGISENGQEGLAILEEEFDAVAAEDWDRVIALSIRHMETMGADPAAILGGTPYADAR